jgi:hypothetical protein
MPILLGQASSAPHTAKEHQKLLNNGAELMSELYVHVMHVCRCLPSWGPGCHGTLYSCVLLHAQVASGPIPDTSQRCFHGSIQTQSCLSVYLKVSCWRVPRSQGAGLELGHPGDLPQRAEHASIAKWPCEPHSHEDNNSDCCLPPLTYERKGL